MIKPRNTLQQWVKKHLWVTFIVATAVLTTTVHFYTALFVPPTREKVWKEVQVTEGMSFKAIAATLASPMRNGVGRIGSMPPLISTASVRPSGQPAIGRSAG